MKEALEELLEAMQACWRSKGESETVDYDTASPELKRFWDAFEKAESTLLKAPLPPPKQ